MLRSGIGTALGLSAPLSVRELVQLLDGREELSFDAPLDADALHGEVHLVVRSDGTYSFSGFMRATGALSFAYKVQVTVKSSAGACLFIETSGRAFGTDTPGDRQRAWSEDNKSTYLPEFWTLIRSDAQMDLHLETNLAGVLGAVVDVAKTVVETYVALQLAGQVAAVVVLGSEIGAAAGQKFTNPDILLGAMVAGGTIILLGPGAMIPAIAAGAGAVAVAQINHRPMNEQEIALARRVFGDTLPIDRIILTDLSHPVPGDNGICPEFVIPGLDGSILVNMGKNYEATLLPDVQLQRDRYRQPGQLFIHELTHAWQVEHDPFLPQFLCRGVFNDKVYDPPAEQVRVGAAWFPTFNVEQQATIIDSWYGAYVDSGKPPGSGLESPAALRDPRFRYVSQNIRLGKT